MNRKRALLALTFAVCLLATMLIGQTALAMGSSQPIAKCDSGHGSTAAPAAPTDLKLTNITDTAADLKWSAPKYSKNVKGYNIYRGGTLVGTATGTTFTDAGLAPNTNYTWTVKAYDSANRLSAASNSLASATWLIINGEVEWATDTAPAAIYQGLIVSDGAYLQIDPGVTVNLLPGKSATIYGTVNAGGSADAMVLFTSLPTKSTCGKSSQGYFNTIKIAAGGMFTGDYVKITYGSTLATVQGMLTLSDSEIAYAKKQGIFVDTTGEFDGINDSIHNCCTATSGCKGIDAKGQVNLTNSTIKDCPGTGVLVETSGTFNGTSVTITNCGKGVEVRGNINFVLSTIGSCHYGLYFNTTTFSGVILNSFIGNDTYGVYNAKPNDVTIDASMNWWGNAAGPSVYDDATKTWSAAGDRVSAGVTYDNWLTEPAQ